VENTSTKKASTSEQGQYYSTYSVLYRPVGRLGFSSNGQCQLYYSTVYKSTLSIYLSIYLSIALIQCYSTVTSATLTPTRSHFSVLAFSYAPPSLTCRPSYYLDVQVLAFNRHEGTAAGAPTPIQRGHV